jgi:energy-coupling factor transporter ATP-binding protein EcfA2
MYQGHYDLSKFPFQLKPDPAFLYLGKAHARARAYMDYTVWSRDGFVVITGEIGSGKTTLVQDLLSRLDERVVVAKIHQTQLDEVEFLQALLANFGIEAFDANKARLLALLNRFLPGQHAKGRQVLLVVDEAQYLNRKVLEEIRLLAGIDIGGELVAQAIEGLQWVPYADRARSGGHRVVEQALKEQDEMPRLVLTKKGVVLDEFPLDKERITIGRHPGNDIVLDERVISGHHAVISSANGGHILRDLGSTNGTYVNAKRIGSHALKHGERIGITLYQLVYLNEQQRASDSHEEATKIFQMPAKA